ncbi:SRPBCC family protein [soil metagenome]
MSTSTSPLRGTATVSIGADAATVYALVSDVTGYGRFSPENRTARWRNGASGPVVGAKFRSWNRRGVFRWFTHCTVETVDHGRVFAFRVTFPPPMPATRWTYRLNPIDDQHTLLEETWELAKPLGPARRAMMRLFLGVRDRPSSLTAGAAQTLARIRQVCEHT